MAISGLPEEHHHAPVHSAQLTPLVEETPLSTQQASFRLGHLCWLLLALGMLPFFGQKHLDVVTRNGFDGVFDFFQEWSSARNIVAGFPVYAPLDVSLERHLGVKRTDESSVQLDVNVHPPVSVLLGLPFQHLEYQHAFVAWNLCSLIALAISLGVVVRALKIPVSGWTVFPAFCFLSVCDPYRMQMIQGQLNLFLLLLIVMIWWADRSEHPVVAGLLTAVATSIKLFPGLLLFYFLFKKQWKAAISTAFGFVAVNGLTTGLLGIEAYRTYLSEVMPLASRWRGAYCNASLSGLWCKLFAPTGFYGPSTPLMESPLLFGCLTGIGASVVLVVLYFLTSRADTQRKSDRAFGLFLTAMLLLSPVSWEHYFLLLLIPLAINYATQPSGVVGMWVRIGTVVLLCLPLQGIVSLVLRRSGGTGTPLQTLLIFSLHCYGLLFLFVSSAYWQWSDRETEASRCS